MENKYHMIQGKNIVLTGTFSAFKRKVAEQKLRELGAKTSGSVTKKTDILFVGDNAGSKLSKATSLGITILKEEDLIGILSDKVLSKPSIVASTLNTEEPSKESDVYLKKEHLFNDEPFLIIPVPFGQEPKSPRQKIPKWLQDIPGINTEDITDLNFIGLTQGGMAFGWNWIRNKTGNTTRVAGYLGKSKQFTQLNLPDGQDSPFSVHPEKEAVLIGISERLPYNEVIKGIRYIVEVDLTTGNATPIIKDRRYQTAAYCGPNQIVALSKLKCELWQRTSDSSWFLKAEVDGGYWQQPKWSGPFLNNQVLLYWDVDNIHEPHCLVVRNDQLFPCNLLTKPVTDANGNKTEEEEHRSSLRKIKSVFEYNNRLYLQPKSRKSSEPKFYEVILNSKFQQPVGIQQSSQVERSFSGKIKDKYASALSQFIVEDNGKGRYIELDWRDVYSWMERVDTGKSPEQINEKDVLCKLQKISPKKFSTYFAPLRFIGWIRWLKPSAKTAHYHLLARGLQKSLFISGNPQQGTHSVGRFLLQIPKELDVHGASTPDRHFPPSPIKTELWNLDLLIQALDKLNSQG